MRRSRKPLGVDLASRGFESLPLRSTSRIRRVDGVSGTLISGIREQFVGGWKPPEAAQEGRVTGTRLALSDLTITVLRSNPLVGLGAKNQRRRTEAHETALTARTQLTHFTGVTWARTSSG